MLQQIGNMETDHPENYMMWRIFCRKCATFLTAFSIFFSLATVQQIDERPSRPLSQSSHFLGTEQCFRERSRAFVPQRPFATDAFKSTRRSSARPYCIQANTKCIKLASPKEYIYENTIQARCYRRAPHRPT